MIKQGVPVATLVLTVLLGSSNALAQVEQQGSTTPRMRASNVEITSADGASYTARFEDDLLTSLVSSGDIPRLKVRGVVPSGYLIRPRTHFVSELLKSVEQI
jgi:hypothetical protein